MTVKIIRCMVDGAWYWLIGYRFNDTDGFSRLAYAVRLFAAKWRGR